MFSHNSRSVAESHHQSLNVDMLCSASPRGLSRARRSHSLHSLVLLVCPMKGSFGDFKYV